MRMVYVCVGLFLLRAVGRAKKKQSAEVAVEISRAEDEVRRIGFVVLEDAEKGWRRTRRKAAERNGKVRAPLVFFFNPLLVFPMTAG